MGYFLFLMAIFLMAILLIAILLEAFFSVMQGIRQHHSAAGASASVSYTHLNTLTL